MVLKPHPAVVSIRHCPGGDEAAGVCVHLEGWVRATELTSPPVILLHCAAVNKSKGCVDGNLLLAINDWWQISERMAHHSAYYSHLNVSAKPHNSKRCKRETCCNSMGPVFLCLSEPESSPNCVSACGGGPMHSAACPAPFCRRYRQPCNLRVCLSSATGVIFFVVIQHVRLW